ncbi:MAG: amidohydrolase [Chloroflexi bacterium]|nr:amidohydrolase [Chloroflexota bacterium]
MSALLFHNARVLTQDAARPRAEAVAVHDGHIVAVGDMAASSRALDADAERFDCEGGVLLPAFIDAHCHLLAYAASLRSVDCTAARSLADIQLAIRQRVAQTPAGEWIRAYGYEETALAEERHPNRHDLDAIAPAHPVRLIHRNGHASVLNSAALRQAGIDSATEEPPGGFLERELPSGEPSGLLLGMDRLIERAVPPLPYPELAAGVREASARLLRAGVACVQDATHTNGRAEWQLFERLIADGSLPLQVVLMEGIDQLGELPSRGVGRLCRGPTKIMLQELGDGLWPDEGELARRVGEAHAAGRQVAIHAIGERAVTAASEAIREALGRRPRDGHRHRIEHCGLLPEGLAPQLAKLGVVIVGQPSFVFERGDRYLRLVPPQRHSSLYAFRALADAGVALAAGSDAPVTASQPLPAVAAAVDRRTAAGRAVAPEQAVAAEDALRWWTAGAAYAAFQENQRGVLRPGLQADLALLSGDPTACSPDELRALSVKRVWLAGQPAAPDAP